MKIKHSQIFLTLSLNFLFFVISWALSIWDISSDLLYTEPSLLAQETSLTMEWPVTISTDISGADTWYYQTGSRMLARILMWNILPSTDWVDVWWYNDDAVDHTSCCREIFAKPTDNELVVNWCNNDNSMHCYQWHNWEWLKYLQHISTVVLEYTEHDDDDEPAYQSYHRCSRLSRLM